MNPTPISKYVIENIDKACENEWIKVYYQPVIRSITGTLVGVEALARWEDPEMGFLTPDKFIPALEENNLITKLDRFILNKVCEDINDRLSNGLLPVPASINFSKLDFSSVNMLEMVEEKVKQHDIPRDLIHIEITETMIASDEELMKKIIDEFRNRGYEIWLDDFGSGYSSLNVLKDYSIDVLKLDMRFLSSGTDKSRAVLRAMVNMAKDIDISVVAEGVETEEQVEFLTAIGCEKLQGYYYSQPIPNSKMPDFLEERNIKIEERKWRKFYDIASHESRDSSIPVNLIEITANEIKTLYINSSYRKQVFIGDASNEEIDKAWYSKDNNLYPRFRTYADIVSKSKRMETFYYTSRGFYFGLQVQNIAAEYGKQLVKAAIVNLSIDHNFKEQERLDSRLRELHNIFESIATVNINKNIVSPLIGSYKYLSHYDSAEIAVDAAFKIFAENRIFPPERKAYLEFMNLEQTAERMLKNNTLTEERLFRVKQDDGAYYWRSVILILVPESDGKEFIYTIRRLTNVAENILNSYTNEIGENIIDEESFYEHPHANLWENAVWDADLMFFWKDKERRFLGASQAFLDFYGFKNMDEIIGKTDEDMHWHVDDDPYRNDEYDVINHGKKIYNAAGQCIVSGVVHNIVCFKMPIYDNGQIVGLMGFFADSDEELYRVRNIKMPPRIDEITNLMNSKAFAAVHVDYDEEYEKKNRCYGMIVLENKTHNRILATFQENFANKVLKAIGDNMINVVGQKAAAARMKGALFAVISYVDSKEELHELEQELITAMESINEVDGQNVTIRIKSASKLCNEPGINSDNLYPKLLGELERM